MRFCGKCGAQVEDGVKFCAKCGNPMPVEQENGGQPNTGYVPTGYAPDGTKQSAGAGSVGGFVSSLKSDKNRLIGFCVTVVLAIVAIILVVNLASCVFGGGYEAPIKKLCKAMEKGDVDELIDAFALDGLDDTLSLVGMSMSDITDEMEDDIDDIKCDSVSYKITDKEKVDKDDYASNIDSTFTFLGVSADDISGMYKLEVEFTAKKDGEKESESASVVVAKVNGDWKIVGGDMVDELF
jgi:hypothetical protein